MIHPLPIATTGIPLPKEFTYPFHYTPHPLCVAAAQEVQAYLATRTDWHEELQRGKMFGVLVVKDAQGQTGGTKFSWWLLPAKLPEKAAK